MTFWRSMPLTNGSGSCFFRHWPSRCQQKQFFFKHLFCLLLFEGTVHLHNIPKIRSQKESQNSRNQGFSYYFCMMIEGSGSGSIPLTSGSDPDPGGPKTRGSGGSGSGFGSGSATLKNIIYFPPVGFLCSFSVTIKIIGGKILYYVPYCLHFFP